jgi:hypothetical protein
LTYLEEHELEKKQAAAYMSSSVIGSDYIDESIAASASAIMSSRRGRNGKESSIKESMDVIVDEVSSIIEDSIGESFDISGNASKSSVRGGRGFANINATDERIKKFEELKIKNFKDVLAKRTPMEDYIGDMEFGIVKERQAMDKKIKDDLRLKVISPRTFNRKARDIERWVD